LTPARVKPDTFACSPDRHFPNVIQCAPAILEQLSALASVGLFRLRHGGLEMGGVLFGYREPGLIRVEAYRELQIEHAFGPAFRLSSADWERLGALLETSLAAPDLDGMTPVGWYVAHTRSGLTLTETDREMFRRYFVDPSDIALILKPDEFLPTRAAWFASGAAEPLVEFSIESSDERQAAQEQQNGEHDALPVELVPADAPVLAGEDIVIRAARHDIIAAPSEVVSARRERRTAPVLYAAGAFLGSALLAATAGLLWTHFRSSQSVPLQASAAAPAASVVEQPQARDTRSPTASQAAGDTNAPDPKAEQPPSTIEQLPDRSSERVKELERELEALRARLETSASEQTMRHPPKPFRPAETGSAARQSARLARRARITPPVLQPADPGMVRPSVQPVETPLPSPVAPAPAPPAVQPAPVQRAEPRTPSSGRMIWTGSLHKGEVLFIENGRASSGAVTGALPGAPVRVVPSVAEFAGAGIVVYSRELQRTGMSENPGPQNGWNYTIYQYDPGRVGDVRVFETPSAQNGWNKIVVRSERKNVSLIMFDWEVIGAPGR
jgi:hypothetical protein